MVKDTKTKKFRFMNPHKLPYLAKTAQDKSVKLETLNQRATLLADKLTSASTDQLVLVPCNVG